MDRPARDGVGGPFGQGHEGALRRAGVGRGGAPPVEGRPLGQQLGAVADGIAGDRADVDTSGTVTVRRSASRPMRHQPGAGRGPGGEAGPAPGGSRS